MSHTKFDSLHKAEKVGIIFVPTIILVVFNVEWIKLSGSHYSSNYFIHISRWCCHGNNFSIYVFSLLWKPPSKYEKCCHSKKNSNKLNLLAVGKFQAQKGWESHFWYQIFEETNYYYFMSVECVYDFLISVCVDADFLSIFSTNG